MNYFEKFNMTLFFLLVIFFWNFKIPNKTCSMMWKGKMCMKLVYLKKKAIHNPFWDVISWYVIWVKGMWNVIIVKTPHVLSDVEWWWCMRLACVCMIWKEYCIHPIFIYLHKYSSDIVDCNVHKPIEINFGG
jgi:hypothetical protein